MEIKKQIKPMKVDHDPTTSKAVKGMALRKDSGEIVKECMEEIMSSMKLNALDLPFYTAALRVTACAVETMFDDSDKQMYDGLMKHIKLTTVQLPMMVKGKDDN